VPDGRIDAETTANIGIINGGTATNVVPKEVILHGEVRSQDAAILKRVKSDMFRQARGIAGKRNAGVRITEHKEYHSFRIGGGDPFLGFMKDIFLTCGIRPELVITGGGSDANVFNKHGILALNISTGMQKVHSHEENIAVEDLVKGALTVYTMVKEFPAFTGKKGERQEDDRNSGGLCAFPFQRCLNSGSCDQRAGKKTCWRSA
jgi:tripeptide aminopeptidase